MEDKGREGKRLVEVRRGLGSYAGRLLVGGIILWSKRRRKGREEEGGEEEEEEQEDEDEEERRDINGDTCSRGFTSVLLRAQRSIQYINYNKL